MIERSAAGEPFEVWVPPETVIAIMHYKDAALAAVELAEAPFEAIRSINYLVDGPRPTPTAGELAEAVANRIPGSEISFSHSADSAAANVRIDDQFARDEWGWEPAYDVSAMIDSIVDEVTA